MNTHPAAPAALPRVPYRQAPLVLLLLIAAILAVTWPWARGFSTHFLSHWDPAFHAWKLEFVARSILAGHLLPPDGNTNMFYPYTGALYFEALHWPQALVAAPLFGLTPASPVLVYHLILVFFWALSGLCFWMFLLALGTSRRAALLGALLFTLVPYRISYMVEFNMQLCFGLPLFFFFMVRFFQNPSIRYACGMALAWWLQAVSELYQAIFLLLILPFPGLALLVAQRELLRSWRRFWIPAACAALVGGTLTACFLAPYLTLLDAHAVNRSLNEIATHLLEPLSYFRSGGRFHFLTPLDVRKDEMLVYPTLAVIVLTLVHFIFDARRLAAIPVPRWVTILRAVRWLSLFGFASLVCIIYVFQIAGHGHIFASVLPITATIASLLLMFHPTGRDTPTVFATGLFAGAVFAYFLSLGPLIVLRHAHFVATNYLFDFIYAYIPLLQGFRVVSRFSIYLLMFMAVASALAWTRIEQRWLRRPAWRWLWIVPLLLTALESLPAPFKTRPVEYPVRSRVLDLLDTLDRPYVLAILPLGDRTQDALHMLQIARSDRLSVYAWGGAYPHYTREVWNALYPANPRPGPAAGLLRQLWPECLVLEDKILSRQLSNVVIEYTRLFADEAEIVAEDDRYALLRLKPETVPAPEQVRLVRNDFLETRPCITFRVRTAAATPAATLWLDLNGYAIGCWEIGPDAREFQIAIPPSHVLTLLPNRFRFHAAGDTPFLLEAFEPVPAPAAVPAAPACDPAAADALPWLAHLPAVPTNAIPLDIRYRNGFAILACQPLVTTAPPGGRLRLRYFVQCPPSAAVAMNDSIRTRLQAPNSARWVEEGTPLVTFGDPTDTQQSSLAATGDLNDILCQAQPAVYALDQDIQIPESLPPGDYACSVVVRNRENQRMAGKQAGKRGKLFPIPVPVRILPQAPAGP